MKTRNRKNGYSANTAKQYVDQKQATHCLSTDFEPQIKFEDGQPTGEIIGHKAWFSQKGLPPFPSYLAMVDFDGLEACEVGYNVYFRADGIKEVK